MKWITENDVKVAAEQGVLPALRCSLKHHRQGETTPKFELIEAIEKKQFHLQRPLCACCELGYDGSIFCEECPLKGDSETSTTCCNGFWTNADAAVTNFRNDYSNANRETLRAAESKVCKYIEEVIKDFIAKEEAKEEVKEQAKSKNLELRHGDYGYSDCGEKRFFVKANEKIRYCTKTKADMLIYPSSHYDIRGNIFDLLDDLKKNSKDLKEFEVGAADVSCDGFKAWITDENHLYIGTTLKTRCFTFDQATEIHQKLGQIIAFARRQNDKTSK